MTDPITEPSFRGYIASTHDALLVFEAARRGIIPKVPRRLKDDERKLIKSGQVFVFDEVESGIKRWTDGLIWSPSRILWNFLIYRQIDKKTGEKGKGKAKARETTAKHGSVSTSLDSKDDDLAKVAFGAPATDSGSPGSSSPPSRKNSGATTTVDFPMATAAYGLPPALPSAPIEGGSGGGVSASGLPGLFSPGGPWTGLSERERDLERALVGSLTSSYPFVEEGLCKKTISLQVNGSTQHLISYYTIDDVKMGRLRRPSSLPELASLEIHACFLHKQNFRNPPHIEVGPDGVPRYRGDIVDRPPEVFHESAFSSRTGSIASEGHLYGSQYGPHSISPSPIQASGTLINTQGAYPTHPAGLAPQQPLSTAAFSAPELYRNALGHGSGPAGMPTSPGGAYFDHRQPSAQATTSPPSSFYAGPRRRSDAGLRSPPLSGSPPGGCRLPGGRYEPYPRGSVIGPTTGSHSAAGGQSALGFTAGPPAGQQQSSDELSSLLVQTHHHQSHQQSPHLRQHFTWPPISGPPTSSTFSTQAAGGHHGQTGIHSWPSNNNNNTAAALGASSMTPPKARSGSFRQDIRTVRPPETAGTDFQDADHSSTTVNPYSDMSVGGSASQPPTSTQQQPSSLQQQQQQQYTYQPFQSEPYASSFSHVLHFHPSASGHVQPSSSSSSSSTTTTTTAPSYLPPMQHSFSNPMPTLATVPTYAPSSPTEALLPVQPSSHYGASYPSSTWSSSGWQGHAMTTASQSRQNQTYEHVGVQPSSSSSSASSTWPASHPGGGGGGGCESAAESALHSNNVGRYPPALAGTAHGSGSGMVAQAQAAAAAGPAHGASYESYPGSNSSSRHPSHSAPAQADVESAGPSSGMMFSSPHG